MSIWTKTSSGWVEIGGGSDGLEGLGDWAVISEVSGSPKRYAYNDGPGGVGGFDWVAFEWAHAKLAPSSGEATSDVTGSLFIEEDGLLDVLLVGPGGFEEGVSGVGSSGLGGNGLHGVIALPAKENVVTAGATSGDAYPGSCSRLGPYKASAAGTVRDDLAGNYAGTWTDTIIVSSITGGEVHYAKGNQDSVTAPGDGTKYRQGSRYPSAHGVVIVRVPAAQAAGVDPGSWVTRIDYYAEVTDGIVTDLYQERFYGDDTVRTENGQYASPEQPDDLIPCDPTVAEGWTYADGEFTPPPPDPSWREQAIEALKEQLKDLQKDT